MIIMMLITFELFSHTCARGYELVLLREASSMREHS